MRRLHVLHLLIRSRRSEGIGFLIYPHPSWHFLSLPTKTTVADPSAPFLRGTSIEDFVGTVVREDLGLSPADYAIEQEIEPVERELHSPRRGELTHYVIYPIDVWVDPARHDAVQEHVKGTWTTCEQALKDAVQARIDLSPTAQAVFALLLEREAKLEECYRANPDKEEQSEAPRRLLRHVAERPSMDALAKKWLSENRHGVRHLPGKVLDEILASGKRAFNLRVADPYLRYQMQGIGFTWSFFTDKDPQDIHVHSAPVVEVYGILAGRLEIWWKPYHDRGTSAWSRRVLEAGDWIEVDSLQCHYVRWLTAGKGVVFKAGPGPLAEVGRLGIKGKTTCEDCKCMKPAEIRPGPEGSMEDGGSR